MTTPANDNDIDRVYALILERRPMGSANLKKRKAVRRNAYDKGGKRMRERLDRTSAAAHTFFFMRPLFIMEFLAHCDLYTLMALAHTGEYARDLVKAFFMANLRVLVSRHLPLTYIDQFFRLLETSFSAIAGSTVSAVVTAPYRHSWTPTNLNIFVPCGYTFMWRDFFEHIGLEESDIQPGIDPKFAQTTRSHLVYQSVMLVRIYV
ncbi:hypothetical protein B0H15DRAFT_955956 [Mycena belliarum]|uniref:Uncharacterized protein n=1 Tax=Mycena belliarum TaxID=1033014 RepID=A0AAD6TR99_9AGAR|nr:hypothetical protein B0H15DRAFT_955956 [Mycena belliae]